MLSYITLHNSSLIDCCFQYQFGDDMEEHLHPQMLTNMEAGLGSPCGKVSHIFVKQFAQQLAKQMESADEKTKKNGS